MTSHTHQFGETRERDRHDTWFAEGALTGTAGRHTWVAGTALEQDGYRNRDVPGFDYRYTTTAFFAQDDYAPLSWLSMSASGRVDLDSDFGAFFSPRVSVLAKPLTGWSARLSTGTGFFVPTPFIDEIDATGLSRLEPLGDLEPERGRSISLDIGWKRRALEVTGTVFKSTIDDVLLVREDDDARSREAAPDHQRTRPEQDRRHRVDRPTPPRRHRSDCHPHVRAGHRAGCGDRHPARGGR